MARALTSPPTDKGMWRRLLKIAHPDTGGDHDLFIWAQALYEYVAGDVYEEPPPHIHRQPPPHPTTGDRLDFEEALSYSSFTELTRFAVAFASEVGGPYASVLRLLADCVEFTDCTSPLYRQQYEGATYKSLAAIAYKALMTTEERYGWYRVAEAIPLSQRHAGHILSKLQRQAA